MPQGVFGRKGPDCEGYVRCLSALIASVTRPPTQNGTMGNLGLFVIMANTTPRLPCYARKKRNSVGSRGGLTTAVAPVDWFYRGFLSPKDTTYAMSNL